MIIIRNVILNYLVEIKILIFLYKLHLKHLKEPKEPDIIRN